MHPTPFHSLRGKFLVDDGCWVWTGARQDGGYGTTSYLNQTRYAHRLMYEIFVGPIPTDYDIDHLCRNPSCVRPDHLEPVPHRVNVQRHYDAKTHCAQGHPWITENIYFRPNGRRMCAVCQRQRSRARRKRTRS